MTEEKKDGDLVQLGALWKNEGKDGQYLSGTFGSAKMFIFKNKWKKGEKDPDYRIYVGARRKPKTEEATEEKVIQQDEVGF